MRLPWTARTRRLLFVVVMLLVLTFPLVSTLVTRARVERSGVDVTATVVETSRKGDAYLVAFRLPEEIDPDQDTYSAEVDRASYEKAVESKEISVRVLEGRPEAHRVEGEIHSKAPYVVVAVADALVLVVGLWWVRVGRRRPTVRIRAHGPLEPADRDGAGLAGAAARRGRLRGRRHGALGRRRRGRARPRRAPGGRRPGRPPEPRRGRLARPRPRPRHRLTLALLRLGVTGGGIPGRPGNPSVVTRTDARNVPRPRPLGSQVRSSTGDETPGLRSAQRRASLCGMSEQWSTMPPGSTSSGPVRIDPAGRTGPTKGQAQGPRWRRTSEGLYVPAAVDDALVEQRIVEQGARLTRGAVTGWAALRLLGGGYFDGLARDGRTRCPVQIAANGDRIAPSREADVRRVAVAEEDVVIRYGVRCASAERALFDAVRWAATLEERVVVDRHGCGRRADVAATR